MKHIVTLAVCTVLLVYLRNMAVNGHICSESWEIDPAEYPKARRNETVFDDFYGTKVADPYRWLEDPDANETKAYVDELNKVSRPFFDACSVKDGIKEKLTRMYDFPKYECTSKRGDYYFYSHNTGLQNQNVLYIQENGDYKKDGKVFFDPNTLSDDGTTHLRSKHFTADGSIMAYELSEKGSDWSTIKGTHPYNLLYYYDLTSNDSKIEGKLDWVPILDTLETRCEFITNIGDDFILKTNLDAPMFKLVKVNRNDTRKENWVTLVEENRGVVELVQHVAGDKLVVWYMEDVTHTLYIHDIHSGRRLYQLPLGIGSVDGFFGSENLNEIFFGFESYLIPTTIYRYVVSDEKGELELVHQVAIKDFNPNDFETKQLFYKSKDGTKIPMYVVHRKGITLDGENPTMLNGYGGFNSAEMPICRVTILFLISAFNNAVFASANIRGGSEYGEKWHEAGMKEKKQNVFDDFIAAAEFLIDQKYTKPEKLGIHGGSNGGLLVAACANQRPELFGAVINRVGVMDMLRYHKFTAGHLWEPELGSVDDDKETFDYIYKYSPLHNLRTPVEVQFPSTLLMTADHDDRVVPLHSLKYIAQLYHLVSQGKNPIQENPIIIRIEVNAGHGTGKPTWKEIEERLDMFSFLTRTLKMEFKK